MKLKNQFLRLFALLGLSMAATSAWAVTETVPLSLQGNATSGFFVNLPNPSTNSSTKITATLTVPEGVKSFKVYDNGGVNGLSSPYSCNDRSCSVRLVVTPQAGDFLHLSGSVTGSHLYLVVDAGSEPLNITNTQPAIYAKSTATDLKAWTYNEPMQIEFWEDDKAGGKNLDLTIDVALDIGPSGSGGYSFTDGIDYLEMHASKTESKVNKTTTLTSPAGTMMYVTFDDVLAEGDTVAVLNGESNSTDTLLKVTKTTNNDVVYVSSNKATICVNTNDNGLDNILRAYARVLTKNAASTAGVDFYKNEATGYTVAKISDIEEGTVSIPNAISVNAIEYDRVFTAGTPSTIVLPFSLPSGATTNAKFYTLRKVVQEENECKWKATMKWIGNGVLPSANTPYAVIVPSGTELTFNLNGGQASFQTGTIADQTDSTGNWKFKGTYQYKTWTSNDPELTDGLAYGFNGDKDNGIPVGKFVRIGDESYAVPMRAYIRKVDENVRLVTPQSQGNAHPMARSVSSIDLPESIDVEFVDDADKPMAIGRMNTVTGAIKIDRWFDLKGRSTNHKPTTKGAFFNKKGIAK